MLPRLSLPTPGSPLALSTWLTRHSLLSIAFAVWITVVVGWSAAIGHTGAELLEYVAPLLLTAALATRPNLPELVRECALIFGIFTGAALVADFSDGSVVGTIAYVIALSLASLYERRRALIFGLALVFAHEAAFGTVLPSAAPIAGLPDAATTAIAAAAFILVALILSVPWATNLATRRLAAAQRALLDDQLAVAEIVIGLDTAGRVVVISEHGLDILDRPRAEVIGQDWIEMVVQPEDREASRAALAGLTDPSRAPVTAPRFFQYEHAILDGAGNRRVFRWRTTVSTSGDRITGTVSAGVDITAGRKAERQLLREQRDLAHLQQLAQAVARETDARDHVVDGIRSLVDGSFASLLEPTPGSEELVVTRATRPDLVDLRVPLDGTPSGTAVAFTTGKPFFVGEAEDHPLVLQPARAISQASSLLYHPVICDGHTAAVLVVGWEEPVAELAERVSNLVALAAEEAASALQRLAAMRRWEEAALTDVLTGIPNRRAFEQLFAGALTHATETGQPISLALMDLNGFKALNDTAGHAAGDRVLKESAALWYQELRPTDVLARLGGDEFAVLLPNCGAADCESVASRLRHALRHEAGCGVGIAVWDRIETPSTFLHRVDEALYADKAVGARDRLSDPDRLAVVEATRLIGAPPDPELDALTELLAGVLGVELALISVFTGDVQFFASQCGLEREAAAMGQGPVERSYCQHPASTGRELIVEDVREHPLLRDNPSTSDEGMIAYAGIPLQAGGQTFGVLCAADRTSRVWSADDLGTLRSVARRATDLIAARAG